MGCHVSSPISDMYWSGESSATYAQPIKVFSIKEQELVKEVLGTSLESIVDVLPENKSIQEDPPTKPNLTVFIPSYGYPDIKILQ